MISVLLPNLPVYRQVTALQLKPTPVLYPKAVISTPYTYKRYKAVKKGDEDKIAQALAKMAGEDKTLRVL